MADYGFFGLVFVPAPAYMVVAQNPRVVDQDLYIDVSSTPFPAIAHGAFGVSISTDIARGIEIATEHLRTWWTEKEHVKSIRSTKDKIRQLYKYNQGWATVVGYKLRQDPKVVYTAADEADALDGYR